MPAGRAATGCTSSMWRTTHGTPVYVHAKVCVVDDVWACVGSDNFNRRSWTHDSELSCAVLDDTTDPTRAGGDARVFARDLRLRLLREHLDRPADGSDDDRWSTRIPSSESPPPRGVAGLA